MLQAKRLLHTELLLKRIYAHSWKRRLKPVRRLSHSALDAVVGKSLCMDMSDCSATSRMESLFVLYHTSLCQHGLNWALHDAQNVAVQHVLSRIRPMSLQFRLRDDLELSHYSLKKDFQGFSAHATKPADAFELVDDGPRKRRTTGDPYNRGEENGAGGSSRNGVSVSRNSRNRFSGTETQ